MQSLTTSEYEKMLALVARYANTPMGRDLLEDLQPLSDRKQLETDLRAIDETIRLNEEKQVSWRFTELSDPSDAVAILRIQNATLEPLTLLELTRLCNQALFARSAIQPERDFAPTLWALVEIIPNSLFPAIERVNRKLLPSGEIDDSASPELMRLRREINAQRGRLQKALENTMRVAGDAIQDQIVTQRNDRYVIPVKADFRGKISGVAHGFSSSGATVFVEPLEAIEANNELQNLKGKEEREVARILFALTEDLREQLPAIEAAVEAVVELDFIKAKVEFARKFKAIVPRISDDETLDLIDARHPLLEENLRQSSVVKQSEPPALAGGVILIKKNAVANGKTPADAGGSDKEIVPVSFKLTKEKSVMIISGANAGGKTVVMKTAGLLSLMAISGLPVPAREATIPFYKSVLADIGDHQSLSANLSTFSSHISNIAGMMRECVAPSLVLLDEVGTGTDPDEGSALGVAIVDYFRRKCGAQIVASTHYRGLKIYAANDENVINASVEFNEKTLQPTYRLLVGLAGASSGIEIARRFGIRDEVIETAKDNLDISAQEAQNYLRKLQAETANAEDLRKALEEEREAVAYKYATLEIEAKKREKERRKQFENELAETVAGFEKQSKAFINSIEDKALKAKLDKERLARKSELNRAVINQVQSPKSKSQSAFAATEDSAHSTQNLPLVVGARVRTSFGSVGVVEKIDKDSAEVAIGAMRLREKLANLQVVTNQTETANESSKQTRGEKLQSQAKESNLRLDTEDLSAELNLIGHTTADAEYEIDRFLDEAYLAALPRIRIIHGFGTGALKNFVHHFLKGHPHVAKYAFAPSDQGGNGATIAELKQ
ncbi:MAG: endonuclease MutS2 [Acidobacteriota bacterium]|nr:endonuclease MutS2 [Acidobacteriota bacterium]